MALPYPAARECVMPAPPESVRRSETATHIRYGRHPSSICSSFAMSGSRASPYSMATALSNRGSLVGSSVDIAEGPQSHQLRPELADSFQSLETLQGFGLRHRTQRLRVKVARQRRTAQRVEVFNFAPEQTLEGLHLDQGFGRGKAVQAVSMDVDRSAELAAHPLLDRLRLAHCDAR